MNLSKLPIGRKAIIKSLDPDLGSLSHRLEALGFIVGESIEVINITLNSNAMLVRIRETVLAIGFDEAKFILIKEEAT